MNTKRGELTRRQWLAASALALALPARPAWALDTIRQGFQTNIWGMPTYYLLKSGLLEKRGIKFEEFAVPSGNLTMQQMVARQVDLGTYAGQSFIIGHDKGGLVAIAQIETVGKTAQIVTRKDLNLSKVSELKGHKVANQTGSSVGNIFTDIIAPAAAITAITAATLSAANRASTTGGVPATPKVRDKIAGRVAGKIKRTDEPSARTHVS